FAFQETIQKARVERIAGAGRVAAPAGNLKRARFEKLTFVKKHGAALSKRGANDRASIARFQLNPRSSFISDSRQSMRKLFRYDQHVNQGQQIRQAFVDVVYVSRNDHAGSTSSRRHKRASRRIVRVEVQDSAAWRQFDRRFVRRIADPVIAIPNYRSFAVALIDDYECDLIARAFDDFSEVQIHAFGFDRLKSKLSFGI